MSQDYYEGYWLMWFTVAFLMMLFRHLHLRISFPRKASFSLKLPLYVRDLQYVSLMSALFLFHRDDENSIVLLFLLNVFFGILCWISLPEVFKRYFYAPMQIDEEVLS